MVPLSSGGGGAVRWGYSHVIVRKYFLLLFYKVGGASDVQSWALLGPITLGGRHLRGPPHLPSVLLKASAQPAMQGSPPHWSASSLLVSNSERLFRAIPQSPMILV